MLHEPAHAAGAVALALCRCCVGPCAGRQRARAGAVSTNGALTQTDHVRVAVGRNYMDATPTSGTIYVGGGPETLEVSVTVEEDT